MSRTPTPISNYQFAGIYKFTHKANGKVYIGQSQNIFRRYLYHKSVTRNRKQTGAFPKALEKYGIDAFEFGVLERVDELSNLNEREQYWMDFYQSYDREKGYNLSSVAGSMRGYKHSESTCLKHSQRLKGVMLGSKNPMYGKVHSDETRRKIAQKATGRKLSKEHKAKIYRVTPHRRLKEMNRLAVERNIKKVEQIDPESDKVVKVWDSVKQAAETLGISEYTLADACRGYYWSSAKNKYYVKELAGGYKWQYVGAKKVYPDEITVGNKNIKEIAQINPQTGETIKIWGSASLAASELGINLAGIQGACRGSYFCSKRKGYFPKTCHGGFKWEYID